MAFSGSLEDRLAIHELVATYADAVSRRNAEEWGSVWAEDALWRVPGFPGLDRVEGRKAIVAAWSEAMTNFTENFMVQTVGALTIDEDKATGRAYNQETATDLNGNTVWAKGAYEDEFVKRDGRWWFATRIYSPGHSGSHTIARP